MVMSESLILGLAIMFALAMLMTMLTNKDLETFFVFLTIFSAFAVWSGLIPLWITVVCIIILVLIIVDTSKRK